MSVGSELPYAPTALSEPVSSHGVEIPQLLTVLRAVVDASVALFVPAALDPSVIDPSPTVRRVVTAVSGVPDSVIAALDARIATWLAVEVVKRGVTAAADVAGPDLAGPDVDHLVMPGWHLLVTGVGGALGRFAGAVAIARRGSATDRRKPPGWSRPDASTLHQFSGLCTASLTARGGHRDETSARRLETMVTAIAVELMPVTAVSLPAALRSTLQRISEFFGVDTSFLRRNDEDRAMTVLVAEWPIREHIADPDPIGEVPFGVDPVFDATRELKEPFVLRPTPNTDAYQERIRDAAGIQQVSMAMVPLIRDRTTVGVLGFVKFGDRPWDTSETNALQAVASLIVQLEARVDAEERLAHQANYDDLTGLPNRRMLLGELERRLQSDAPCPTVVFFIDLDRFKVLNDSLGRASGDRLLVTVAARLTQAKGPSDFVARLSGDEFVFVRDRSDPAPDVAAVAAADLLLALVATPTEIGGYHITRTASLGIAIGKPGAMVAEELLAHADAALQSAKTRGGNHAALFDERLRAAAADRSEIELLLRESIDRGDLQLFYQPEIDLRTGALLAVEALVRWVHPRRGLLTAGDFIEVAEDTGLIVDLGRWVMAEACRQMAAWRTQYPALRFKTRVNISPAQLASQNIVRLVAACLKDNNLPGRLLCLEITEHAVMADVTQALEALHELKSLGVTLAIDDFGTGFSSMSQLKRLPVDTLKVDQTFVLGLGRDGGDRAIVDASVRLARAFGLEVVAEGVETKQLAHELLGLGCYRAQGFLLSRPIPAAELDPILRRGGIDASVFTLEGFEPDPTAVDAAPLPV